jgi:hypothetical protein
VVVGPAHREVVVQLEALCGRGREPDTLIVERASKAGRRSEGPRKDEWSESPAVK